MKCVHVLVCTHDMYMQPKCAGHLLFLSLTPLTFLGQVYQLAQALLEAGARCQVVCSDCRLNGPDLGLGAM